MVQVGFNFIAVVILRTPGTCDGILLLIVESRGFDNSHSLIDAPRRGRVAS